MPSSLEEAKIKIIKLIMDNKRGVILFILAALLAPPGLWTLYQAYENKQEESSFWLHNASYLRLKSLEVGYTLPKALFNSTSISKLRIYASGTNLLTFSKEKYFDPESSSGYPYYYPVTRLTSIGVNLIF